MKYTINSARESPLLKRGEESILLIIKTVLDILSEALYKQKPYIFCRNWSYKSGQCKVGGILSLSVKPLQRTCMRYHTNSEYNVS